METVHKSQEQRVRGPPVCEEELGAGVPIVLDIKMLLDLRELGPRAEEPRGGAGCVCEGGSGGGRMENSSLALWPCVGDLDSAAL